jgi:hypothetical protein
MDSSDDSSEEEEEDAKKIVVRFHESESGSLVIRAAVTELIRAGNVPGSPMEIAALILNSARHGWKYYVAHPDVPMAEGTFSPTLELNSAEVEVRLDFESRLDALN